jgi:hypothetical protein
MGAKGVSPKVSIKLTYLLLGRKEIDKACTRSVGYVRYYSGSYPISSSILLRLLGLRMLTMSVGLSFCLLLLAVVATEFLAPTEDAQT